MRKELYRSDSNKVFAGIIGGIGEYLEVDAALLRVVWVAVTVFTGFFPGLIIYILALFIIPRRGSQSPFARMVSEEPHVTTQTEGNGATAGRSPEGVDRKPKAY